MAQTLGEGADGDHQRMLAEMLRLIIFQALRPAFEGKGPPPAGELSKFARAILGMARADKLGADSAATLQALKLQEESALRQKAEGRRAKPGKLADLSGEQIRRALLGYDAEAQDK